MDPLDRYNIPDPMGWLGSLTPDLSQRVLDQCDALSFEQGEAIYHAGDPPGGLYALLSGRLDLHWPHFSETETLWYVVGPGWWIGDLDAFSGQRRQTDLIAGQKSIVLRLTLARIRQLQQLEPAFLASMLTISMATSRKAISIVEYLSVPDITSRVAACLTSLSYTASGWNGHLPVTQSELARIVRASRGRVLSALHQLEGEELIKLSYGAISILDAVKMRTKWVEEASRPLCSAWHMPDRRPIPRERQGNPQARCPATS